MSHRRLIPLEKRTCLGCDKLFIPTRTNQYYCTGDITCKQQARNARRVKGQELTREEVEWYKHVVGLPLLSEEKMKSLAWELL